MSTDTTVSVLFRKSIICDKNGNKNLIFTPNTEQLYVHAVSRNPRDKNVKRKTIEIPQRTHIFKANLFKGS